MRKNRPALLVAILLSLAWLGRAHDFPPLERALVIDEIEISLRGRRRAAPLTLYFGTQREQLPETFELETRVGSEAESGLAQQIVSLRRDFSRQLEPLRKQCR